MTVAASDPLQALQQLAESFTGRPLTEGERAILGQWARQNLGPTLAGQAGQADARDAVEQGVEQSAAALRRTEQTIRDNQTQTASAIQSALQAVRKAAEDAKQAVETEEKAILEVIQRARSLGELRETGRMAGADSITPGSHMAIHQIGNRLEVLITQQVSQEIGLRMKEVEAMTARRLNEMEQRVEQAVQVATGRAGPPPAEPGGA